MAKHFQHMTNIQYEDRPQECLFEDFKLHVLLCMLIYFSFTHDNTPTTCIYKIEQHKFYSTSFPSSAPRHVPCFLVSISVTPSAWSPDLPERSPLPYPGG